MKLTQLTIAVLMMILTSPTTVVLSQNITVGGDRPAIVKVPGSYDPAVPTPLLILLHGLGETGTSIDAAWRMTAVAEEQGFLLVHPNSLRDPRLGNAWDAIGSFCTPGDIGFDDSSYLRSLIEEIEAALNVDADRIYCVGSSLGGRMAYRMACEHASKVTAIASVAGTGPPAPDACQPEKPVHVLHLHGTSDFTILFAGGTFGPFPTCTYLGAYATTEQWAALNGCSTQGEDLTEKLDIDAAVAGAETIVRRYGMGCARGGSAELWAMNGTGHAPTGIPRGSSIVGTYLVVDWLLRHPRRESPQASFTVLPPGGTAPLTFDVDASTSTAPEGTTLSTYHWDFGDGTRAEGKQARHTFVEPGVHVVSLIVVTDDGRAGRREQQRIVVSCPIVDVAPWTTATVGATAIAGGAALEGSVGAEEMLICTTGLGGGSTSDDSFLVFQEVKGDGQVTARIPGPLRNEVLVGVQFRESLEPGARFVASALEPAGSVAFPRRRFRIRSRSETGAESTFVNGDTAADGAWIRLERRGDQFLAEGSVDGIEWKLLGEAVLPGAAATLLAGIAVGSTRAFDEALRFRATDLVITRSFVPPALVRGDCNGDGGFDLSDAIRTLGTLFQGDAAPVCDDACDANDDGVIDISDAITTLGVLFLGQGAIPPPGTAACGEDPTQDVLDCQTVSMRCQ